MSATGRAVVTMVRGMPSMAMRPMVQMQDMATPTRGRSMPWMLRKNTKSDTRSTTRTSGTRSLRSLIM